ncbi:GNAT family N-acetyltransferase [Pseudoruegeria sp. SHC-113]|uniref:GNAT family N-acetyltransferase n=1 Tax=Pseudoruegeria sp. SHC-113 TaxID=2855439 RepID=UPI0021BACA6B|nr:GNAT family N-acetyltransferase [Pseudoruegeria sp. SHC-113]MCT8161853.1 GNAT family N-acetyltransferase [Pseudoruegeria sp. SHC-113]
MPPAPFHIAEISAEATLDIRQAVLWPDHPRSFSKVENDAEALHLGGFLGERMVSVISLYDDGDSARIRKFATLPDAQGKGCGGALFGEALRRAVAAGHKRVWLSGRATALGFYAKRGFAPFGDPYEKEGLPYRAMEWIAPKP